MSEHKINDAGDSRKYFMQLPNMIDDLNLSLIAFRLYIHLKRVAGENGVCYQSSDTLAKACNMGVASVVKAKKELLEARLIQLEESKEKSGRPYHIITITDIWPDNMAKYGKINLAKETQSSPHELQTSLDELQSSPHELQTSPGEPKKNLIKNNPIKNSYTGEIQKFLELGGFEKFQESEITTIPLLVDLIKEHGTEKFIECARWVWSKDNMTIRRAYQSMVSALPGWTITKEKPPKSADRNSKNNDIWDKWLKPTKEAANEYQ